MSPPADSQPSGEAAPTPADGGTLLPPSVPSEVPQGPLQGLGSMDSSLIADTSHVQQLINHGADVNAPDNNGWTPLHTAAYHGQEEIVRILLAANANVNARNKSEETPLHLAAKWPQDRVVEALLSGGADLTARNKRGRTPAHVASLFNRHAILDRLLNAGADVNALDAEQQTPLHLAVRPNCPVEPELVKTLIRHNADLEAVDARGHTPLHFLPCAQDWLHWAAYEGKESLLRVLLAKPGVRPDCYSEEGLTPLHLAAHVNNANMVTMLISAGAKANAPSQPPTKNSGKDNGTYGIPLPGAPGSITAGISISSQIKAYGSSKLPPGELTALHIAAERGSAELIRVLVAAGAKVNIQGERGMPPLHVAVWEGNTAAVVSLLAAKASVSLKSKAGGFTSVHCACLSSRATPELLALLLDNGGAAVIEERCQEGWTALHLACQAAPPAMVELLLQRGARPGAKGKNGRTAADCASKRPEILQLLHVATGGKVPLPLGLGLGPSVAAAAAAANGLLTPNGVGGGGGSASATASGGGGSGGGAAGCRSGSRSGGGRAAAAGGGGGRGGAAGSSSSCSQASGLLPGTAAMLEPLESVEATLAALLADMGGALCSLQAGAVFGAGLGCAVDPVGHCIRPLDKRLVMLCTLGCQFSFHLPCWKAAREVLKERWSNFGGGSLAADGRYCCIAPGCPGYIREQLICDGTQMQSTSQSRLYYMAQEVYDSLPAQAKPIGGGVPPPPGGGDGGQLQHGAPLQPALPAGGGGGGLSSLAALGPSLTLAQAMVQAATAVGNMVGGGSRHGASQLAAALAATGGLPALLAGNGPPVPPAMSAREAAAIAAETLGVSFGGKGRGGDSSCVVEDLGSGDDLDDELEEGVAVAAATQPTSSGRGGGGGGAAARGGGGVSSSSTATANGGGSSRKQGGGGGGGSSSRRGAKGSSGGKLLSGKSTAPPPISSAAAAEMLQQLQGLQQAVAAVQSAVGAGVHSMGLSVGGGAGAGGATTAGGADGAAGAATGPPGSAGPPAAATAASAATSKGSTPTKAAEQQQPQQQRQQQPTVLEPPQEVLLPPRELPPACPSSGSGDDDGGGGELSGGGDSLHEVAPVPPPRRRSQPILPMSRRAPPPLTGVPYENGRQPLSPQLATPPPATSLLTPGVQSLLIPPGAAAAAALRQPHASLAPILVGQLPQPSAEPPLQRAAADAKSQQPSASAAPFGGADVANGCAPAAVASGSAAPAAASATTPAGSEAKPTSGSGMARGSLHRGLGGGFSGSSTTSTAAAGAAGGKPEPKSPDMTNGPTSYGMLTHLTTSSLSIGLVHGGPLAAAAAVAAAAAAGRNNGCSGGVIGGGSAGGGGPSPSQGLTVTRVTSGKAGPVATLVQASSGGLYHIAKNYGPGDYARAVCPGLRPGVHRVTRSAGRSPPSPGATVTAAEAAAPEVGAAAAADIAAAGSSYGGAEDAGGEAIRASGGGLIPAVDERGAGAAAPGGAAPAVTTAVAGAAGITEAAVANGSAVQPAAAREQGQAGAAAPAAAAAATEEAAAPSLVGAADGDGDCGASIVLAALRSLRQQQQEEPSLEGGGATAAADDVTAAAASDAAAAAAAEPPLPSPPCRHLLLESGDIPLLAATPGMLEAWLSAHVATHGRLAAYRILAPQAAVAVSMESAAAAAAAASCLRARPNLLVAPLSVAPLEEFPDDDVLAASAQQVARAGCPSGDRSWMRRMVELWEQLHALPPVVREAAATAAAAAAARDA